MSNKIFDRLLNYLKNNWGVPFVFLFIVVLCISTALLSVDSVLANNLGFAAYWILLGGIILQIVSYLKFKGVHSSIDTS